jgi:putative restriction endonuclease
LSGGYEDDKDFGDIILYTGEGGNWRGKQVESQILKRGNLALAKSCAAGFPIRLIRGGDGARRARDNTLRKGEYCYDGLYMVDSFWAQEGTSGYRIWRYRLIRLDPRSSAEISGAAISEEVPGYDEAAGDGPSPRRLTQVQRIVRSTQVAASVKQLYESRCQVCQTSIQTLAGSYAESAHIKPLGMPHNGQDHQSNILCLCPNHHVMFDLGGFVIQDDLQIMNPRTGELLGDLHVHPRHDIDIEAVRYHRALFTEDVVVPFEPGLRSYRRKRDSGAEPRQEKMFRSS